MVSPNRDVLVVSLIRKSPGLWCRWLANSVGPKGPSRTILEQRSVIRCRPLEVCLAAQRSRRSARIDNGSASRS